MTTFEDAGTKIASARTQDRTATVEAARCWLDGATREALYAAFEHVDRNLRAHRALAEEIEAALACEGRIAGPPSHRLWIEVGDRACQLAVLPDDRVGCALMLSTTQVVRVEVPRSEVVAELDAWLHRDATIADVRARRGDAEIAPNAERFERGDVAGWLWANLWDGADRGTPALAGHRALIAEILERPTASRFFAFTSLTMLCFSRCSHYPFDTRDMPFVSPTRDGYRAEIAGRVVEGNAMVVADALEAHLATIDETPWHGVGAERFVAPLNDALEARGCALRATRTRNLGIVVEVGDQRIELNTPRVDDGSYCIARVGGDRRDVPSLDALVALVLEIAAAVQH